MNQLQWHDRFFSKVEKTEKCWNWKGQIYPSGYGSFWLNNKNVLSHRASWILHFGEIPITKIICHRCDNRKCVNPNHLFIGSPADNSKDMVIKRRSAVGEKNPANKLKTHLINEITQEYERGASQRSLAEKYNVSQRTIGRVVHGKRKDDPRRMEKMEKRRYRSVRCPHCDGGFAIQDNERS